MNGAMFAAILSSVLLGACVAKPHTAEKRKPPMHPQPARVEPLVVGPTVDNYTYTNEAKLTKMGPHRFMIPANYFTDQMGPDFQGGVSLELLWPQWEPLPPGRSREMSMNEFNRQARASYDYIADRRNAQDVMDRRGVTYSDDPILKQDPLSNLAYRTRGEDVYGLERWYVSESDKARYLRLIANQEPNRYGWPSNPDTVDDMYVKRDAAGHILTFITCDPPTKPNGLIIQGERLIEDDTPRVAQCSHYFALPQFGIMVDVDYPRVLLGDWARIQARFSERLEQFHIGTEAE